MSRQFCKLQACTQFIPPTGSILAGVLTSRVATPLNLKAWRDALITHPDKPWVDALLQGIQSGFRVGLRPSTSFRSSARNLPSVQGHEGVIRDFLSHQVQQGFMLGPFSPDQCPGVITSPIGVVPKSAPGSFRVIVALSSPSGSSVNDNLRRDLTHVTYSSVDDAALLLHHLGEGALLAKVDVQSAYRLVPIHPSERVLFGVRWDGHIFLDCQLPFGLASAPAIFSAIAEALEWILVQKGVRAVLHYLDDFLLLGPKQSRECAHALEITQLVCRELGIPLAKDKIEGPSPSITFLGIRLSSDPLSISLPPQKLTALRHRLAGILDAKCFDSRSSLESLVGYLVHACKVCPLGKAFLSGLFHALRNMGNAPRWCINTSTRADIAWWHLLCTSWEGVSVQQFLLLGNPDRHLFTDASGSWGCGAHAMPSWLQATWPQPHCLPSIALKELIPVLLAAAIWGCSWSGSLVQLHTDNAAVVTQVNNLYSRDLRACNLLRVLAFFQALFD